LSQNKSSPKIRVRLKSFTGRQWSVVALIATATVVFAVLLFTGLSRLLSRPASTDLPPEQPVAQAPTPAAAAAVPKIKAMLFFASEDGMHLVPTEREVPLAEGPVAQARSILEAQLSAEAQAPLISTIPKGAALRGVFVSQRNEVFVDLDPSIRTSHPGGTEQELMTVYAIVNAVLINLPNLQEVQILIGGQEVDTLAGHVDLRRPLRKNDALIQSSNQ
jgi:hypothetical protein